MDEQQIRKIAQSEMLKNYRSGSPIVPRHTHDGNDNVKIKQSDIILNNKFFVSFILTPGTASENTFTLRTIENPSSVEFHGFAFNSTDFRKATITGRSELGNGFILSSVAVFSPDPNSIIETCNAFYTDAIALNLSTRLPYSTGGEKAAADLATYRAFSVQKYPVLAGLGTPGSPDGTPPDLVSFSVTKFTNNTITFSGTVATNWTLNGNLIIT